MVILVQQTVLSQTATVQFVGPVLVSDIDCIVRNYAMLPSPEHDEVSSTETTGARSLEVKLLSGKTIILSADGHKTVHEVLHLLPGADWLSIGSHRVPSNSLISEISSNSTLTARARLRGGGRIFMTEEASRMSCKERSVMGYACSADCTEIDCINRIPEASWHEAKQTFIFPDSKVQVVRGEPLDDSNKGLLVTRPIKDKELVAVFGSTASFDNVSPAGKAFNSIRDSLLRATSYQRQLQYSVFGTIEAQEGEDGKTNDKEVWIVPRADADLALEQLRAKRIHGGQSLDQLLRLHGPLGKGHLANHVCCEEHRNLAIEVVQIRYSATPDGPAIPMPVAILRARRPIAAGELGCTQYQRDIKTWGPAPERQSIFQCSCCKCQGHCQQAPHPVTPASLIERWNSCDIFFDNEPIRAESASGHHPYRLHIPRAWGNVELMPASLRRLTVRRSTTNTQRSYLNDDLVDLLSMWAADGRPLGLPMQGQARVVSSFFWTRLIQGEVDLSGRTDDWSTRIPIPLLKHVFIPIHHPNHWCLCHINTGSKSMTYIDPASPEESTREASVRMNTWLWMFSRYAAQNWERLGVDIPRWEIRLCDVSEALLSQLPDITKETARSLYGYRDAETIAQLIHKGLVTQAAIDRWEHRGIYLLGTKDKSLGGWNWSARPHSLIPRQTNAFDCGMFVILYILYGARGWTMNFDQNHIEHCRSWFLRTLLLKGSWEESFTCQTCNVTAFSGEAQPQLCAGCHQGPVGKKRSGPPPRTGGHTEQRTHSSTSRLPLWTAEPPPEKEAKNDKRMKTLSLAPVPPPKLRRSSRLTGQEPESASTTNKDGGSSSYSPRVGQEPSRFEPPVVTSDPLHPRGLSARSDIDEAQRIREGKTLQTKGVDSESDKAELANQRQERKNLVTSSRPIQRPEKETQKRHPAATERYGWALPLLCQSEERQERLRDLCAKVKKGLHSVTIHDNALLRNYAKAASAKAIAIDTRRSDELKGLLTKLNHPSFDPDLNEGREWFHSTLGPWLDADLRLQRRSLWCQLSSSPIITVTLHHCGFRDKRTAIAALAEVGIILEPSEMEGLVLKKAHSKSGALITGLIRWNMSPSSAIQDLFLGDTTISDEEGPVRCFVQNLSQRSEEGRTFVIHPSSTNQQPRMKSWSRVWEILGASESQILHLITVTTGMECTDTQPNETRIWSPNLPRRARTVWGNYGMEAIHGQIRIDNRNATAIRGHWQQTNTLPQRKFHLSFGHTVLPGEDSKRGTSEVDSLPVSSSTLLLLAEASAETLETTMHHYSRHSMNADVSSTALTTSLDCIRTLQEAVCKLGLELAALTTPSWLINCGPIVRLRPLDLDCDMNGVSSILINYVQIKRMKGSPQIIERPLWVKRTLLKLTNEIQLAIGKENRAFRLEDILLKNVNHRSNAASPLLRVTGTVGLRARKGIKLEDDILVGALVAFYIGNNTSDEKSAKFKWCPVANKSEQSLCAITSISAKVHHRSLQRRPLYLGRKRKNRDAWVIDDLSDPRVELLANTLNRKSAEGILDKLHIPFWQRRQSQLNSVAANGIAGTVDNSQSISPWSLDPSEEPIQGTWMPSSTTPQFLLASKRAFLRHRGAQGRANTVRGDWKSWEVGTSYGQLAWSKGDCLVSRFWAALSAQKLTSFYLEIRGEGRAFATAETERIFRDTSGRWILWNEVPHQEQQIWLSLLHIESCFTQEISKVQPGDVTGADRTYCLHDKHDLNRFSVKPPARLNLQLAKRTYLKERGDVVGARNITGDWRWWQDEVRHVAAAHTVGNDGSLPAEEHSLWGKGGQLLSRFWTAMWMKDMSSFTKELEEEGRLNLAHEATLLLGLQQNRWKSWSSLSEDEQQRWLMSLQIESFFTLPKRTGNILSWNMGPAAFHSVLPELPKILANGPPLVFLQEVKCRRNQREWIRRTLEQRFPRYKCLLGTSSRSSWSGTSPLIVATLLSKEVFTSAKSIEWQGPCKRNIWKQLKQDRVQFLEATLRSGEKMDIINMHNATSGDLSLQRQTFDTLGKFILNREGTKRIMCGDMNADYHRSRTGYASDNAPHMEEVDAALETFVQQTKGWITSPMHHSRKDVQRSSAATLDHLILWNIPGQVPRGQVDWNIGPTQDHARITYAAAPDLIGVCVPLTDPHQSERNRKPLFDRKMHRRIVHRVDEITSPVAKRVLAAINDSSVTPRAAMEGMTSFTAKVSSNMQKAGQEARSKRARERGPGRSKEQLALMRCIEKLRSALHRTNGVYEASTAARWCFHELNLKEDLEAADRDLSELVRMPEWPDLLKALMETYQEDLEVLREKQSHYTRYELERREQAKMLSDLKEGKASKSNNDFTEMKQLEGRRENGFLWILAAGAQQAHWQKRLDHLTMAIPGISTKLEEHAQVTKLSMCVAEPTESALRSMATWLSQLAEISISEPDDQQTPSLLPSHLRAGSVGSLSNKIFSWVEVDDEKSARLTNWTARIEDYNKEKPSNHPFVLSMVTTKALLVSIQVESLKQLPDALSETKHWPTDLVLCRAFLSDTGPWKGENMTSSLEIKYEFDGFSPLARCPQASCSTHPPVVMVKQPTQNHRKLTEIIHRLEVEKVEAVIRKQGQSRPDKPVMHVWNVNDQALLRSEGFRVPVSSDFSGKDIEVLLLEWHDDKKKWKVRAKESLEEAWVSPSNLTARTRTPELDKDSNPKTHQGRPSITLTQERREMVSFCHQCWSFQNFRTNKDAVPCMDFMHEMGIFSFRCVNDTTSRLRNEVSEEEWKKFIASYLKPNKAMGPDQIPNEVIIHANDEEREIIRLWANEILTSDALIAREMSEEELRGSIRMLYKGKGNPDNVTTWRPVVLLNGTYQLIGYILNERLQRIVNRACLLEPGQCGFRADRSTDMNIAKMDGLSNAAKRQGKCMLRIDIDFTNAFNAMSQSALWAVMENFKIPDVDFLKSFYNAANVRLAPNDATCATIRLDTGVAQGSVLSPTLFVIFINALLRMLSATGVSHRLEGIHDFNHVAFADDISIFAGSQKDMQKLIDAVRKFQEWSGMKINLNKTFELGFDDTKGQEWLPEPVSFGTDKIKVLQPTEAVRYLGVWGNARGDKSATKTLILSRLEEARDLVLGNPLPPEEAIDVFIGKGIGSFRYSAAVMAWSEREVEHLESLWLQAYKAAWKIPTQTASCILAIPEEIGGSEYILPKAVIGQEICAHLERCLRHDDVLKQITLMDLEEAKRKWWCNSFPDLQEEAKLRSWNEATSNKWLLAAKCLSLTGLKAHWFSEVVGENTVSSAKGKSALVCSNQHSMSFERHDYREGSYECNDCKQNFQNDKHWLCILCSEDICHRCANAAALSEPEQESARRPTLLSWAEFTRQPRLVLQHLVRLGCKQEDWGAEDWNLSQESWNLIWTGASALQSAVPILMKNGNFSPARLPMERRRPISTKNSEAPNFYLPDELRASQAHGGKQVWRPLIPRVEGLGLRTRALVQKYIDLIDLNDIGFNPEQLAPGGILHYQTSLTDWLKWIDSCETDLVLRDAQGNPREDEKHMVGCAPKAGSKAHFDAINHTGLIKSLRKRLEEPSTLSLDAAKSWWQEICARLHPFHRGNWQETIIDPMIQAWAGDAWRANVDSILDRALQSQMDSPKNKRQKAKQEPAVGVTNIHNLGEALVDNVLDARMQTRLTIPAAPDLVDMEFLVKIRRCSPESCRTLLQLSDKSLCDKLLLTEKIKGHTGLQKIFLLPEAWFEISPTYGGTGWWAYPVRREVSKLCAGCNRLKLRDQFSSLEWRNNRQTTKRCLQCPSLIHKGTSHPQAPNQRPRQHACSKQPARPDSVLHRKPSTRNKGKLLSLEIRGSSDSGDDGDEGAEHVSILFRTADPRYTGNPNDPQGGDSLLDIGKVRELLRLNSTLADSTGEVWLSSREMGYDITEESACSTLNYRFDNPSCPHCRAGVRYQPRVLDALNQQLGETAGIAESEERPSNSLSGCPECRATKVCLAPAISDYIRQQDRIGSNHLLMTEMKELDLLWGCWPTEDPVEWDIERGQDGIISLRPHRLPPRKITREWESASTPLTASDPDLLPNNAGPSLLRSFMDGWRLDGEIPLDGGIRIMPKSVFWEDRHDDHVILSAEGLSSNRSLTEPWTIMSSTWNHLQHHWEGRDDDLIPEIHKECKYQDKLEEDGYRSPSWRVLRALKDIVAATRLQGESMITAPPFFTSAFRGDKHLWGHTAGPTVYLWESLSEEDQKRCMTEISANHKSGWIILCRQRPNVKSDSEDETCFKKLGKMIWSSRKPKVKDQVELKDDHSEHPELPHQKSTDGEAKEAKGRGLREKGWWKRGNLDLNGGKYDMACWVDRSTLVSEEMLENLSEAWYQESEKDECTLCLEGPEREYWLGTEVGRLGGYECKANTMATDGSEKGNMGAGCVGLNNDTLRHNVQIGRSEEGAGSNRPEMGAMAEALRIAPRDQPLLLFCDSENTLNTILKWVGEGARVALHHCEDADILKEVLKLLHERHANKASTFLIKVKAHRGEPLNEGADTEAELGRENECIIWNDRTNRMVYSWTDKHGKQRCGTWSRGVRQAFKWGAAHAYLQKSLGRVLPKWKSTSTENGSVQLTSAIRSKHAEHTLQCLEKLRNNRLGVMESSQNCRRGARQMLWGLGKRNSKYKMTLDDYYLVGDDR